MEVASFVLLRPFNNLHGSVESELTVPHTGGES